MTAPGFFNNDIAMVACKGVTKSYGSLSVLKGVDLLIKAGTVACIVGPSGAGKSTLLHILGTLDKPDSGEVKIDDVIASSLDDKALSQFRNNKIGFVFQFHHLLPEFSALENVCLPGFIGGRKEKEVIQRAKHLLEFMGLQDRVHHKPSELSGGEQQRVSVARALVNDPAIVLADEPTGNLDTDNAAHLHELFFDLCKAYKTTFVIVTHNEALATRADQRIQMLDGLVV
jgi:lipoprotein-releasing system ATP-binding protein